MDAREVERLLMTLGSFPCRGCRDARLDPRVDRAGRAGRAALGRPPTGLFFLFAKNALVPVGLSNRYQWMPKATGEKPGVLD